jgi:DNA-binding SARP family transcriptional activator
MFLRAGREKECASKLAVALEIGRDQGYTAYSGRHNRHVAELCLFALNHDIETDYARFLIRKIALLPPPGEMMPETWPWPVRIFTLGHFQVLRYDEPLQFSTKVQKKPLELLMALVALGGSCVSTIKLGELLWPDAEGDAAQQNLKSTLHRLRKLIGHKALDVQGNHVGLNSDYCWMDASEINICLDEAKAEVCGIDSRVEQLATRIFELYRGPLLPAQEESWVIVPRELLRSKLLKVIKHVAGRLSLQGKPDAAIIYYNKLLDLEPLREDVYVDMMNCYKHNGQQLEAVGLYQQLCALLDSHPDFELSKEAKDIYQSIVS